MAEIPEKLDAEVSSDEAITLMQEDAERSRVREAKLMSLLLQEDMGHELADSISEIERLKKTIREQGELVDRLRARIAELEAYVAFLEGGPVGAKRATCTPMQLEFRTSGRTASADEATNRTTGTKNARSRHHPRRLR